MYFYINGITKIIKDNFVVLECNNIGYKIYVSNPFSYKLDVTYQIYLYTHIKEDEISLYGFKTVEELELFTSLISVKGVGPKTALPFLVASSIDGIIDAINRENILYLTKFPKIGEKTARQIILDLKGKLISNSEDVESDQTHELISALESLGYKTTEIKKVLPNIEIDKNLESAIKEALKLLMR